MKLRPKILLIFLLVAIMPLALIVWLSIISSINLQKDFTNRSLSTTLDQVSLATSSILDTTRQDLSTYSTKSPVNEYSAIYDLANDKFLYGNNQSLQLLATSEKDVPNLQMMSAGSTVKPVILSSDGKRLAILRNNPWDKLQSSVDSGQTNDVLILVNKGTQYSNINRLRFGLAAGDLTLASDTKLLGSASGVTTDYRSKKVTYASKKVSGIRIVAKYDQSEIGSLGETTRETEFMLGFIMLVIVTFLALQLGDYFTKPLLDLTEAARAIGQGNLKKRVLFQSRDELGQLSRDFNNMANRVEEIDRVKSNFVSLTSHHLRTPQTIIRLATAALLNPTIIEDVHDRQEALKTLKQGVEELGDVSETLLSVSAMQTGKVQQNYQPCDIEQLIEDIVQEKQSDADRHSLQLTMEHSGGAIVTNTDIQLIKTIIRQLLQNAIIFTKTGSITVTYGIKNKQVWIRVHDTGIGIPPSQIKHIFSEFYQADNAKTVYPTGKGLGLYLAKLAIAVLRGTIEISSQVNRGTTATIHLPFVP